MTPRSHKQYKSRSVVVVVAFILLEVLIKAVGVVSVEVFDKDYENLYIFATVVDHSM